MRLKTRGEDVREPACEGTNALQKTTLRIINLWNFTEGTWALPALLPISPTSVPPHSSCPGKNHLAASPMLKILQLSSSSSLIKAQNILLGARQSPPRHPSFSLMALFTICSKDHLICEERKSQCLCNASYYLLFLNCVFGRGRKT